MFEPAAFFREVPFERGIGLPLLYYLAISIVSSLFSLAWVSLFPAPAIEIYEGWLGDLLTNDLLVFFLTPFLAALTLAISGPLIHLFVRMMARKSRGIASTLRVLCYANGPSVFGFIPWVGLPAALVWSVVMTTIGLREAHRMTTGAAFLTIFLTMIVFVMAAFAAAALIFLLSIMALPGI